MTTDFTPDDEWLFVRAQLEEAKKRRITQDIGGYEKRVRETNLAALIAETKGEQA
jgi:hypothetical protein